MTDEQAALKQTEAWLLMRGQRRTRRSTCSRCGQVFKHPASWSDDCADCVAASIDKENMAGWNVALSLGLHGIKSFRRYGDPWLYLGWDCPKCGGQQSKRLVNVKPDLVAHCSMCVSRIKQEKRDSCIESAVSVLEKSGHFYLNSEYPYISFSCGRCGRVNKRSVLSCSGVVLCLCSSNARSKGEMEIQEFLLSEGVNFIPEYNLSALGCGRNLRADFFLPDRNMVIEYDGEQHFKPIDIYGGEQAFKERQRMDLEKDIFLSSVGVDVVRVSYKCSDIKGFIRGVIYG